MIIQPTGFTRFRDWADQMSYLIQADVPQFNIVQSWEDDESPEVWQEWALCIVGGQDRLGQDSPDPYQFDDWREWAERLFETQDFSG